MKIVEHEKKLPSLTKTFLSQNKLRTREISNHAIKVENGVDVSAFFTQIIASISSVTLKHIIGVCGKQNTSAPETVMVCKNNFASPLVWPLGLFKFFVGLVIPWQYFYYIFKTYGSVSLDFYILIIFQQAGRLQRSVKDVAIDAEGFRFNSQFGKIRHSVASGLSLLQRFFGAALHKR